MRKPCPWLVVSASLGIATLVHAGSVADLHPYAPLMESPIPPGMDATPAEIRTRNNVFGPVDPLNLGRSVDDTAFASIRWPCIVKAMAWVRLTAATPRPTRADALIPRLKAVFASEGVPPELAWIAEVESRFDPDATSRSGARGLFQFMPATAEQFGLITESGDLRSEPELSARAAAQYLSQLYARFKSWPLALAAYNAGEGRVGRLLKQHHADSFDEIAIHLPPETQEYVPKIMATLALRENTSLNALPSPVSPTWN